MMTERLDDSNGLSASIMVAAPPPTNQQDLNDNASVTSEASATSQTTAPLNFNDGTELSLDEAIAYLRIGRFHVKLLLCVGLFMISTSLQFSILTFLAFVVQCEMPAWGVTDSSAALLSTLVFFGMLVGTLAWGVLSDMYGRKPIMLLVACTSTFFSILRAGSHSYESLLAIQFFLGATLSGFGVAFTYFVEFFPTATRAKWSMLLTLFWTFGIILGTLFSWATISSGFRALCVLSTAPSFLNIFAMIVLPKSPHFLVSRGRMTEARDIFLAAAASNKQSMPPGFVLVDRKARHVSLRAPICAAFGPRYRRTTFLLYFIWFALGFTYYGAMMMSSNISEARDLMTNSTSLNMTAESDSSFCPPPGSTVFSPSDYTDSLVVAIAEIPGIFIGWMFVDRAGRKATQAAACFGFAAAIFILGVIPNGAPSADLFLLFVARGLSNTAYSVTWIYTPEVFPSSFRTTAFATAECFSHLGSMLTPFVGQTMLADGLLPESCMIYCAAALLCMFASLSLKVETSGKQLGAAEEEDFPRQFSSRFDLEMTVPPISGAPSMSAAGNGIQGGPLTPGGSSTMVII